MCEKTKKKLPESVEKGVVPLLVHVCCARMVSVRGVRVLISLSRYKQDVATTIICVFISRRCSLSLFFFKTVSTNQIGPAKYLSAGVRAGLCPPATYTKQF